MAKRQGTQRATWIAAAAIVGLALVVGLFLAPHHSAQIAVEPAPMAARNDAPAARDAEPVAAPAPSSPTTHADVGPVAAAVAAVAPTQIAVSAAKDAPDASTDGGDAGAGDGAPKLSAEEQGLADAVGDTRRASPATANSSD